MSSCLRALIDIPFMNNQLGLLVFFRTAFLAMSLFGIVWEQNSNNDDDDDSGLFCRAAAAKESSAAQNIYSS